MKKKQVEKENLRLMVFAAAEELGKKVDKYLLTQYGYDPNEYTFIVDIKENFFEDGHLKVEIEDTVRGKDVFFITDIGNYSIEYKMHGYINHTSPNDLMVELKDGIMACSCHTKSINIVMPLLYAGRQHRRNTRESLQCGNMLRELDQIPGIKTFITFDAHDQAVEHALHGMEFDNFYPTNVILEKFINDAKKSDLKDLVFVAPDNGATGRRNVYLNSFKSPYIKREAGSFVKQRDYNNFVDGKYPVIAHDYCGNPNLEGKTAIISDDMISSGGSMFDVIDELKKRGIKKNFVMVTYALFTKGIEKFDEYYNEGKLDGVYTTDLSYIPKEYQKAKWLHVCECSSLVGEVIYDIHNDLSISKLLHDLSYPGTLIEEKFKKEKK